MTWKHLPEKNPGPPLRPAGPAGEGGEGRPIKLYTNHFPLTFDPNIKELLYHYDVIIKDSKGNETLPKNKKKKVFAEMTKTIPVFKTARIAYDSEKNAYSVGGIPQIVKSKQPCVYKVPVLFDGNKPFEFTVSLQKVANASLQDLLKSVKKVTFNLRDNAVIFQMLEILFKYRFSVVYEQVGRNSFFSVDGEFGRANPIGGGKEGISGFFTSLRPAAWKDGSILVNIDVANTAFYKHQSVIDFVMEVLGDRVDLNSTLQDRDIRNLTKELKGIEIQVTHSPVPRKYRVNSVMKLGPSKLFFTKTETVNGKEVGRKVSVLDYFRTDYPSFRLRHPELNCLHVGNVNKTIYMPMEVCMIAKGQKVKRKLTDRETANFIRGTARPPRERLDMIRSIAAKSRFNQSEILKALHFTVEDMPLVTTGHVLPAPKLSMQRVQFEPRDGVWDIRDKQFISPATLSCWAVVNFDYATRPPVVEKFVGMLVNMGKEKGMVIEAPCKLQNARQPCKPLDEFTGLQKSFPKLQMVLCILPKENVYAKIKLAGDREMSLITQCVTSQNVWKAQAPTISNLLLKINGKLGGVNNHFIKDLLPVFKTPVIIMGADVNHPTADNKVIPSIAAVLGSYDANATKYAVEVRHQTSRQEMIEEMKTITINLLKNFFKKTGRKPERIIMFRDGVSESQFMDVLCKEMTKMREACKALQKDYAPGITFICVQKRHHTRLFCDDKDGVGKSRNVPPGTTVSKDITHPTEMDFFLCSHQGIQGTSKPTHYHILWDDNDIPLKELQRLTYSLCHVYSRCTRSVSIPAPAYYAHLAAFRAKVYLQEHVGSDYGSVSSGEKGQSPLSPQELKNLTHVDITMPFQATPYYI